MRARAHIGLRRDLDAQADLRDIIRLSPQCSLAYRLLGELAARRDENDSAAIFFREALRLDPDDQEAADWLQIVDSSIRPAAVAKKIPAPAAAAGRFPVTRTRLPPVRGKTATGDEPSHRTVSSPARGERPGSQPRFARGTASPDRDERPTQPFARGSDRDGNLWKTPTPAAIQPTMLIPPTPLPLPPPPNLAPPGFGREPVPKVTITGRPATQPPAAPTKIPSRPIVRTAMPELPGFGDYLVSAGILSRERLRAAQAYQRSMKVQLSTAIVTLGLATPQRIEWASVAHQSQLARERQQQA